MVEGILEHALRWIALLALLLVLPIGLIFNTPHHLSLAAMSALCGAAYVWLGRRRALPYVRPMKFIAGCALAWLVGVISFATGISLLLDWTMD